MFSILLLFELFLYTNFKTYSNSLKNSFSNKIIMVTRDSRQLVAVKLTFQT